MGGPQTTRDAWRASKEYEKWANVINKSKHAEYHAEYQLWRNHYANYPNSDALERRKLGQNSVRCGCGGQYKTTYKCFLKRHEDCSRHRKWVEEQKNKKPKKKLIIKPKPKRVVCKFLW